MPRRLFLLRFFYFACFSALGVSLPFLPRWLSARGVDGIALGVIMATLPAMGLIAPPTFGALADALGLRGYLLRVACGGAALAFGLLAACGGAARALGFPLLFFTVLGFAFFRAPMLPIADVIAMEEAKTGTSTYPRIRLWGSVGFLVTVIVAGRFLDPTALTPLPLALTAALSFGLIASFGLPSRVLSPPLPAPGHVRALLRSPDFPVFLAVAVLWQACHSSYDICYSMHLADLGVPGARVGLAWGIGVVAEIVLMAFGAPLFARFTPARLFAAALVVTSGRWLLIAFLRGEIAILVAQPLHAFSFGLMWITSLAYIRDRVPPRSLATAQGVFTSCTAAGSVGGALLWAPLYKRVGGAVVFAVAALVALVACLFAVLLAARSTSPRLCPNKAAP